MRLFGEIFFWLKAKSEKRKAKSEKRKAKSEKRKAKSEKAKGERRIAKSEKQTPNTYLELFQKCAPFASLLR